MKEINKEDMKLINRSEDEDCFKDRYTFEKVWCDCCKTKKRRSLFITGGERETNKEHNLCNDCRSTESHLFEKGRPRDINWGYRKGEKSDVVCPAIIGLMEERTKS